MIMMIMKMMINHYDDNDNVCNDDMMMINNYEDNDR